MTARTCRVATLLLFAAFAGSAHGFGLEYPAGHLTSLHGPHAVHGYVVRGTEVIYFEADAAALNAHLAKLAENGVKPVVSLHEGKLLARTPWTAPGKSRSADWSVRTRLDAAGSPRVHVYLGGRIGQEKIVLPEGVEALAPEADASPASSQ